MINSRSQLAKLLCATLAALTFFSHPVRGQTVPPPITEIQEWDKTAAEAISLLRQPDIGKSGDSTLNQMRDRLTNQRDLALELSTKNTLEVQIVTAQLDQLGPLPGASEVEPRWKSEQRRVLEVKLAQLRKPMQAAEESYARSIVLIDAIDDKIDANRRSRLFQHVPSPISPANWAAFISELTDYVVSSNKRMSGILANPANMRIFAANLPMAAIFALIGLLFLFGLHPHVRHRFNISVIGCQSPQRRVLLVIMRDISGLIVPFIAIGFLVGSLYILNLAIPVFGDLVSVFTRISVIWIVGSWLGYSLLRPGIVADNLLDLSKEKALLAARLTSILALLLGLEHGLKLIEPKVQLSANAAAVVQFVLMLLASGTMFLLARVLLRGEPMLSGFIDRLFSTFPDPGNDKEDNESRHKFVAILARLMALAAIAAVTLCLIGYVELSREILLPSLLTLAAITFGFLTFKRTINIIGAFSAQENDEDSSSLQLLPTLLGLTIVLVLAPLIALFWGARAAELNDFVVIMVRGFEIGNFRVSIGDIVTFVFTFTAGYILTRWIQRIVGVSSLQLFSSDRGLRSAMLKGIGYIGLPLSAIVAIMAAGLDLSSLAIVAGALSVGAGLGLQSVVSNFISGVILLIERPVKEGDWIEVNGHSGIVEKISVRSTRIRTVENEDVILPNSELTSGAVRNRTYFDTTGRIDLKVGIAYGSDLALARAIMLEIVEVNEHTLSHPAPLVVLDGFGDSTLEMRLMCFITDVAQAISTRSELRFEIVRRFAEAGIEIPYPQRNVTLHYDDSKLST